jgi:hypothetical protein
MVPVNDDEWDDEEEEWTEVIESGFYSNVDYTVGENELEDLLLNLTADAVKTLVLLREIDTERFAAVEPRLASFLHIVSQFPEEGAHTVPKRRRIGFMPAEKPEKPRKKKKPSLRGKKKAPSKKKAP